MAFGFDVDRLLVWLAPREPDGDPLRAGSLCKRHADAMVVPRGWTLDDRREDTPRLFRSVGVTTRDDAPRRRRAATTTTTTARQLVLDAGNAPVADPAAADGGGAGAPTAPCVEVADGTQDGALTVAAVTGEASTDDPDATTAIPWRPEFDTDDDLGGVLDADTPLLARAFRGTDRPR